MLQTKNYSVWKKKNTLCSVISCSQGDRLLMHVTVICVCVCVCERCPPHPFCYLTVSCRSRYTHLSSFPTFHYMFPELVPACLLPQPHWYRALSLLFSSCLQSVIPAERMHCFSSVYHLGLPYTLSFSLQYRLETAIPTALISKCCGSLRLASRSCGYPWLVIGASTVACFLLHPPLWLHIKRIKDNDNSDKASMLSACLSASYPSVRYSYA